MLEGIMAVAANGPPRHRPPSKLDAALRVARTCYDHLAGRLGVGIADALCERGHIVLADGGGAVTENGADFLLDFGVDLTDSKRRGPPFCHPFLDLAGRRPPPPGAVGPAEGKHLG